MMKNLFHGSDHIIEKPIWHGGKKHNDYGYGFYTTEDRDLACEWASDEDHDGYVNQYHLDLEGLTILDLENESYNALNWLEILLENRTFSIKSPLAAEAKRYLEEFFSVPYKKADIIIGYRADDSYFRFAQDFLNGTISYQQLVRSLKFGNLGTQIVIRSRMATDRLQFDGYEVISSRVWYPKKEARERQARKDYNDLNRNHYQRGELYMVQILDEEVRNDDARLR